MAQHKRPFIAGNWKMHGNKSQWQALASGIAKGVQAQRLDDRADVVICPPLPALVFVRDVLAHEDALAAVKLGAQNLYPGKEGPYTGEASPEMLRSVGCDYVIVGHSERREILSETDAFVAKKTIAALEEGLIPIVCIGEGEDVTDAAAFLEKQLTASLDGVGLESADEIIIAYEPVWAIGNGKTATPDVIQKTTQAIRQTLETLYGDEIGRDIRILYGGSMKGENATEIMAVPEVAGGLIGGASLKAESFLQTIKNAC